MKIAFAQFEPRLCDLEANIKIAQRLASAWADADLVVLPELASSGYNFPSRDAALGCSEEANQSAFISALHDIAAANNQYIVSGFCERSGEALYNSAALVGPEGLVAVYRKLHLFIDEKDIFTPGDRGLVVCDIPGARVGMLICFDWIFPEAWRVLALRGAEIICHPSNLVIPGKCQSVVPAQAICNRVFVITANRVGAEGELRFTGESLICDPNGAVLARGPDEGECVRIVEIDPSAARDKMATRRNDIFADRRPDQYRDLTEL